MTRRTIGLLVIMVVTQTAPAAVTVTVDGQKEYETILGFGCTCEGREDISKLVGDLGVSAHRHVHGCSDGIKPVSGRAAINYWTQLWQYCSPKKPR